MTIGEAMIYQNIYKEGCETLEKADVPESALDARILLEYVCRTNRNDLLVHGEREVSCEEEAAYRGLLAKRAKRIPLQHLTGVQNFMGLDFQVNEHILIPRQDTEILVEEVLRDLQDGMGILDMCTGSGCILISLLHYSNDCHGVGVDLSEEALQVAEENANTLLGPDRIQFVKSNLFDKVEGKFEVIVSNPPYIPSAVVNTLMPEVRDFEPHMALDGTEDGLYFYREITAKCKDYLYGGGKLYFEIGCEQALDVSAMMEVAGFKDIHVVKDYAGLDRVVYGTYTALQ